MDEAQAVNKIEANLPQEKIKSINNTHAKEVEYWKKVALDNKNEDERKIDRSITFNTFFSS